jgi:DNA/RNA-binding protein KIN17
LKWYCNFCKRQCSDENGYKVHCSTFSHKAAVERYNRDPSGNRSSASNDFLNGFCAVLHGFSSRLKLKRGKGTQSIGGEDDWVDSNLVYQEYIKDRHHTHLSATRWNSVAGFVRFLGQKGIAQVKKRKNNGEGDAMEDSELKYLFGSGEHENEDEVEEDENVNSSEEEEEALESDPTKRPKWFIKLIDKSPEAILASKSKDAALKKASQDEQLQARQMNMVERQAATSSQSAKASTVVLVSKAKKFAVDREVASIFTEENDSSSSSEASEEKKKPKLNPILEKLAAEEVEWKKKRPTKEDDGPVSYYSSPVQIDIPESEATEELNEVAWIQKGLLVRIGNEEIGEGKYFRMLAVIDQVIQDFGAQVTVLKSGDQLLLDQEDCLPVSRVKDSEFDSQLSTIDPKLMSSALKTDKCVVLLSGLIGKEGRVLKSSSDDKFNVELTSAGVSHIHRKQLDLVEGQLCIYWE